MIKDRAEQKGMFNPLHLVSYLVITTLEMSDDVHDAKYTETFHL